MRAQLQMTIVQQDMLGLQPTKPTGLSIAMQGMPTDQRLRAFQYWLDASLKRVVLEEDAAVCELNQRGLHSRRHKAGVLMPEEYELHRFHRWVGEQHEKFATSTSADSAR